MPMSQLTILPVAAGVGIFGYLYGAKMLFSLALKAARRAAGLRTRIVIIDGLKIPYLDGGRGEPVVLIHGFGANKDHWPQLAKHLTHQYRVIAPDLPGFGEADRRMDLSYTVSAQIERLHEFITELRLDSFHIGGNSMGGLLAAVYAARYPQSVKSLWLLAPAGVATAQPSELMQMIGQGKNLLLVDNAEDFAALTDLCFFRPPYVPPAFQRLLAARAIADRPLQAKMFQDLFAEAVTLETTLHGVTIPTLILWGDHDRLLHVSGAEVLAAVLPKADKVIMKDMGHCPQLERPQETAEIYLRFQRGAA